jgi:hypothetical protein
MTAAGKQPDAREMLSAAPPSSGRRTAPSHTGNRGAERGSRRESVAPPLTVVFPPSPPTLTPGAAVILLRILSRAAERQHTDPNPTIPKPRPGTPRPEEV